MENLQQKNQITTLKTEIDSKNARIQELELAVKNNNVHTLLLFVFLGKYKSLK